MNKLQKRLILFENKKTLYLNRLKIKRNFKFEKYKRTIHPLPFSGRK